jgi:hypothetical protein
MKNGIELSPVIIIPNIAHVTPPATFINGHTIVKTSNGNNQTTKKNAVPGAHIEVPHIALRLKHK